MKHQKGLLKLINSNVQEKKEKRIPGRGDVVSIEEFGRLRSSGSGNLGKGKHQEGIPR